MTTSDKISIISLIIAALAIAFSIISYRDNKALSLDAFTRNYRPYVFANSYAYVRQSDQMQIREMHGLLVSVVNAPALIVSENVKFYIRDINNVDSLYFEQEYHDIIAYPFEKQQLTISTDINIVNPIIAQKLSPKKLIRKVHIEYTWLAKSKDSYYFESEWEYSLKANDWVGIYQKAN